MANQFGTRHFSKKTKNKTKKKTASPCKCWEVHLFSLPFTNYHTAAGLCTGGGFWENRCLTETSLELCVPGQQANYVDFKPLNYSYDSRTPTLPHIFKEIIQYFVKYVCLDCEKKQTEMCSFYRFTCLCLLNWCVDKVLAFYPQRLYCTCNIVN